MGERGNESREQESSGGGGAGKLVWHEPQLVHLRVRVTESKTTITPWEHTTMIPTIGFLGPS